MTFTSSKAELKTTDLSLLQSAFAFKTAQEYYAFSWALTKNYTISIGCHLIPDKIKDFIKFVKGNFTNIVTFNANLNNNQNDFYVEHRNWGLHIQSNYLMIYTKSLEHLKSLAKLCSPFISKNVPLEQEIRINYCSTYGPRVVTTSMIIDTSKYIIYPELYPDLDIEIMSSDFRESKSNILILYGDTGTGKTTVIKHLLISHDTETSIYCDDAETMQNSQFWSTIVEEEPDMIILDDLRFDLTRKDPANNKGESSTVSNEQFLSNLLSSSDGLFARDTKYVITTNQKKKDMDPALVRDGRCFDCIKLNQLSYAYAKELWVDFFELDEKDFVGMFKQSKQTVPQSSLMTLKEQVEKSHNARRYMR